MTLRPVRIIGLIVALLAFADRGAAQDLPILLDGGPTTDPTNLVWQEHVLSPPGLTTNRLCVSADGSCARAPSPFDMVDEQFLVMNDSALRPVGFFGKNFSTSPNDPQAYACNTFQAVGVGNSTTEPSMGQFCVYGRNYPNAYFGGATKLVAYTNRMIVGGYGPGVSLDLWAGGDTVATLTSHGFGLYVTPPATGAGVFAMGWGTAPAAAPPENTVYQWVQGGHIWARGAAWGPKCITC